jgi:hypothetical protein
MSVGQLVEQLHEEAVQLHEEEHVCTRVAPPITSRFLFVNVAAMRAETASIDVPNRGSIRITLTCSP